MPVKPISGEILDAISADVAAVVRRYCGRGPEEARTFALDDDTVVARLHGGLTVQEQTLLAAGRGDLVREVRRTLAEVMRAPLTSAVETATGRRVAAYHSDLVFEPTYVFGVFVLARQERALKARNEAADSSPAGSAGAQRGVVRGGSRDR